MRLVEYLPFFNHRMQHEDPSFKEGFSVIFSIDLATQSYQVFIKCSKRLGFISTNKIPSKFGLLFAPLLYHFFSIQIDPRWI